MRLDFIVANSTELSRKEAKRAIHAGEVKVDGIPCRKTSTHIQPGQAVTWQGALLSIKGDRYLMLNKPRGVVSATIDSDHMTVLSLLPTEARQGLHIVGRLDKDTTGLLLLTTDGQWSHRITAPRSACAKTYRVELAEPLTPEASHHLENGVRLRDEDRPTAPARAELRGPRTVDLTITEGRYHQVRRMLAAVGNHVESLHRLRIGDIYLDSSLAPGQFRPLSDHEINSVR
nr:pseudouridine synthase [Marinobacter salicampi]